MIDKEYLLIGKGLWNFFKYIYGGTEIKRFAIVKDKTGNLYRNVQLPYVKLNIMKRGEKIKCSKWFISNYRTSIRYFKQ